MRPDLLRKPGLAAVSAAALVFVVSVAVPALGGQRGASAAKRTSKATQALALAKKADARSRRALAASGKPGPRGDTGPRGEEGVRGPEGLKGDPGATGAVGAPGTVGATGLTGPTGPAAAAGYIGFSESASARIVDDVSFAKVADFATGNVATGPLQLRSADNRIVVNAVLQFTETASATSGATVFCSLSLPGQTATSQTQKLTVPDNSVAQMTLTGGAEAPGPRTNYSPEVDCAENTSGQANLVLSTLTATVVPQT